MPETLCKSTERFKYICHFFFPFLTCFHRSDNPAHLGPEFTSMGESCSDFFGQVSVSYNCKYVGSCSKGCFYQASRSLRHLFRLQNDVSQSWRSSDSRHPSALKLFHLYSSFNNGFIFLLFESLIFIM